MVCILDINTSRHVSHIATDVWYARGLGSSTFTKQRCRDLWNDTLPCRVTNSRQLSWVWFCLRHITIGALIVVKAVVGYQQSSLRISSCHSMLQMGEIDVSGLTSSVKMQAFINYLQCSYHAFHGISQNDIPLNKEEAGFQQSRH